MRKINQLLLPLFPLILTLILAGGCAISEDREIAMGIQAAPQFEKEFGGLYHDREVQEYVDRIGRRLARHTGREDLPWEFRVLENEQINAFALPGGPVYITSGLLFNLRNESQLAAILAHEAGHVAHRHSVRQLERAQVIQGGAGLAGLAGGNVGDIGQIVGGLALMKYGRDQEKDADLAGLEYLVREGYNPRAMVEAMQIMKDLAKGGRGAPEFLSTHPDPANRMEYLEEHIARRYANIISRGRTERDEFEERVLRRRR